MKTVNEILSVWNILIFLYFSFKDWVLSKIFKNTPAATPKAIILITAIIALLVNEQLLQEYNRYLEMSFVKGAIKLPPFPLIFIIADFIGSILFMALIASKSGVSFLKSPKTRILFNLGSIVLIWVVFSSIAQTFWLKKTTKNMDWDYECFKEQINIDLAVYYLENRQLPQTLGEFTSFENNPINESPLIYKPGSKLSVEITDEMGNKILEGYKDLMGIEMYVDSNQAEYFNSIHITNNALCNGKLTIPAKFR